MLKSELLEMIKDMEDTADVDASILGAGFSKSIDSIDAFKELLDKNQLVQGFYASEKDRAVSKGITTYEANTLPKKIEEAIKAKSNEGKSPAEIKLEEMQKQLDNMLAEKTKAEMSSKYIKTLGEKGLDAGLIDFVLGHDDETTTANIDKITSILTGTVDAQVKAKLNQGGAQIPPTQTGAPGAITWEQVTENPALMEQYTVQNAK